MLEAASELLKTSAAAKLQQSSVRTDRVSGLVSWAGDFVGDFDSVTNVPWHDQRPSEHRSARLHMASHGLELEAEYGDVVATARTLNIPLQSEYALLTCKNKM